MSDQQYPKRIGSGMIWVASLLLLGMLTFFFSDAIERKVNPNSDPQTRSNLGVNEVVLLANDYNHYVATAHINGVAADVLLDTGATQVAISQNLAQRIGLTQGRPISVSTANGTAVAYATRLESVRLGNIELRDVKANIVTNMSDPQVLLGMSFLKELEMSQRDGSLILRQYPE